VLDKLNTWFVNHFVFKKQAKNVVKYVADGYSIGKTEQPDWSQMDIFKTLTLAHGEFFNYSFEDSKEFIEECCKTIHGTCYLIALWSDIVFLPLEARDWRSQQDFRLQSITSYVDKELEKRGFPPQSKEQKEQILDIISKFKLPAE